MSLNLKQNNSNSAPYLVSTLLNWQLCTVHIMIKFHYVDYHSKFNREILTATVKQECISLECILSAAVAASGRRCLPGGLLGGVDPLDPEADTSPPPPRGPLWTEFLTHACENISFPQLLLRTVKKIATLLVRTFRWKWLPFLLHWEWVFHEWIEAYFRHSSSFQNIRQKISIYYKTQNSYIFIPCYVGLEYNNINPLKWCEMLDKMWFVMLPIYFPIGLMLKGLPEGQLVEPEPRCTKRWQVKFFLTCMKKEINILNLLSRSVNSVGEWPHWDHKVWRKPQ